MPPKEKHILFLTEWYPTKLDPQFGIFVKKHALAASLYNKVSVIYLCKDPNHTEGPVFTQDQSDSFYEQIVYFHYEGNPLSLFFFLKRLYTQALKNVIDLFGPPTLVQLNVTGACAIGLHTKQLKNTPYVCFEHGSYLFNPKLLPFHIRHLTFKTLKNSKAIICVSEFLAGALKRYSTGKEIFVVGNVIEQRTSTATSDPDKIKIITVSDLIDRIKNISGLINAFKKISSVNKNIFLEIIGDGENRTELETLAGDELNKSISFLGRQSNDFVLNKINTCDFFVLNSNIETFCITALEAIGAGKPVIVTKCGGPETYMKDIFGTLIEKNNQKELEMALLKMTTEYKNYDEVPMKQFVAENYSSQKIGKALTNIYHEILK